MDQIDIFITATASNLGTAPTVSLLTYGHTTPTLAPPQPSRRTIPAQRAEIHFGETASLYVPPPATLSPPNVVPNMTPIGGIDGIMAGTAVEDRDFPIYTETDEIERRALV